MYVCQQQNCFKAWGDFLKEINIIKNALLIKSNSKDFVNEKYFF